MFKRKGGGVKGLLNNVKKKLHFSYTMASLEWYWYVPCFPTQIKQKYEGSSCSTNSRWAIEAETSKVQLFSVIQARVLSTRDAVQISWWWPEKWLAVKVHLAGGGLELEPPSTTLHYLPPRRVRTLVPYFPASDDSSIMLSNTHWTSEIQTNRGIGTKSHNYFWCCCNTQKW